VKLWISCPGNLDSSYKSVEHPQRWVLHYKATTKEDAKKRKISKSRFFRLDKSLLFSLSKKHFCGTGVYSQYLSCDHYTYRAKKEGRKMGGRYNIF
jgi:hypothetical protein